MTWNSRWSDKWEKKIWSYGGRLFPQETKCERFQHWSKSHTWLLSDKSELSFFFSCLFFGLFVFLLSDCIFLGLNGLFINGKTALITTNYFWFYCLQREDNLSIMNLSETYDLLNRAIARVHRVIQSDVEGDVDGDGVCFQMFWWHSLPLLQ